MSETMGGEKIRRFTQLLAWQHGHRLVLSIYTITRQFPKEERFGLIDQLRRAAVSITANTAEGFSRFSPADKARFYLIAKGSLIEVQNHLLISRDVGYISADDFNRLADLTTHTIRIINGLISKTRNP